MHERTELTLQQLNEELAVELPARELMGAAMVTPGARTQAMPWDPPPAHENWAYGQPVFYYRK